jgi:hypothetical protein
MGVGMVAVESVTVGHAVLDDSITTSQVAVLDLMDKVAYKVMTSEDTNILCRKDTQGKYYENGDVMLSPPEAELLPT